MGGVSSVLSMGVKAGGKYHLMYLRWSFMMTSMKSSTVAVCGWVNRRTGGKHMLEREGWANRSRLVLALRS